MRWGHLFITEKAVFANWAVNKKITFKHPTWPVKDQTDNQLDTPFLKKYWAFIKKGGNMADKKKKPNAGEPKKEEGGDMAELLKRNRASLINSGHSLKRAVIWQTY